MTRRATGTLSPLIAPGALDACGAACEATGATPGGGWHPGYPVHLAAPANTGARPPLHINGRTDRQ